MLYKQLKAMNSRSPPSYSIFCTKGHTDGSQKVVIESKFECIVFVLLCII